MTSTALTLVLILREVATLRTWGRPMRKRVLPIRLERVRLVVWIRCAKGHYLSRWRLRAAWIPTMTVIPGVGHHARRVGIGRVLGDVVPAGTGMTGLGTGAGIARIVVLLFLGLDVDGLGPLPSGAVRARQCGSAAAAVAGRVDYRHCVPRGGATRDFGARGLGGWRGNCVVLCGVVLAAVDDLGARGRVGGVDLVNVVAERVPVLVFVFVVVFLRGGVVVVVVVADLDTRVFFFAQVVAVRVVVDCDSFPNVDGHVSLAFGVAAGRERDAGRGGGAGSASARRGRGRAGLGGTPRERPP